MSNRISVDTSIFLFTETKEFVEELFVTLKNKSYIPGYVPPPPPQPPPPPPPSDASKQDNDTSQPSALPPRDPAKENNTEAQQQQTVTVKQESREIVRKSGSSKVRGLFHEMSRNLYLVYWVLTN